ncbi:unnamed protein product [Echinostoma caproni]|uniref:SH2 domain-containing protein n=1 Tax=Echinostoma caproni TaxID=27848 RepID=A0A183A6T3_9TREM|nr:unnamed protein product [Echinostoma caproni]
MHQMRSELDPLMRNPRHLRQNRLIPLVIVEPNSDADTNSEAEISGSHSRSVQPDAIDRVLGFNYGSGSLPCVRSQNNRTNTNVQFLSLQDLNSTHCDGKLTPSRRFSSMTEITSCSSPDTAPDEPFDLPSPDSRTENSESSDYAYRRSSDAERLSEARTWPLWSPSADVGLSDEQTAMRILSYCHSHAYNPSEYYWSYMNAPKCNNNSVAHGHGIPDSSDESYLYRSTITGVVNRRGSFSDSQSSNAGARSLTTPQSGLSPSISTSTVGPEYTSWMQPCITSPDAFSLLLPSHGHLCESQILIAHSKSTPHMDYRPETDRAPPVQSVPYHPLPLITLCRPASMNGFDCAPIEDTVDESVDPPNLSDRSHSGADRRKSVPNFTMHAQPELSCTSLHPVTCHSAETIAPTAKRATCRVGCRHSSFIRDQPAKRTWFSKNRTKKLSLQDNRTWLIPSDPIEPESSNYLTVPNTNPDLLASRMMNARTRNPRDSNKPRALSFDFGSVLAHKRASMTGDSTSTGSTRSSTGQLGGITNHLLHRLSLRRLR